MSRSFEIEHHPLTNLREKIDILLDIVRRVIKLTSIVRIVANTINQPIIALKSTLHELEERCKNQKMLFTISQRFAKHSGTLQDLIFVAKNLLFGSDSSDDIRDIIRRSEVLLELRGEDAPPVNFAIRSGNGPL